jgi:hypothetical protein
VTLHAISGASELWLGSGRVPVTVCDGWSVACLRVIAGGVVARSPMVGVFVSAETTVVVVVVVVVVVIIIPVVVIAIVVASGAISGILPMAVAVVVVAVALIESRGGRSKGSVRN